MKKALLYGVVLLLAVISLSLQGWCLGGFVEYSSILVTGDSRCLGQNPWQTPPAHNIQGVPAKGWLQLSPPSTVRLSTGTKAEFYVFIYNDHSGRTTGRPEVTVAGKKITISISEKFSSEPKAPVYVPSLWSERVTVENLSKGTYQVFLHKTLAGKIAIP
jgi:hypothetical protein